MSEKKNIYVTRTFLPPQGKYNEFLDRLWETSWLTNRGELVLELESKIKKTLKSTDLFLTNNGTVPLQLAIKAMQLKGEVITTPFSYVASTSSIIWEGLEPIFVDIHPEYLTIDETKIEAAITNKTSAILATHVYGNPCNIEVIEAIARKHRLKVIFDSAHCFGVTYRGKSIFNYGDVSTCSFHATKIFHTGEGGAMFIKDKQLLHKAYYHHNFGHDGSEKFHGLGINGKISELQAAMGLAVLPFIDALITFRKKTVEAYMAELNGLNISFLKIRKDTVWNYAYFPIILESEEELLHVKSALEQENIFPRRYFYPSLNKLPYLRRKFEMPVSESIARRVLCLPLYHDLQLEDRNRITQTIQKTLQ